MYRVRWGRLMHERFNNADAANLFQRSAAARSEERAGLLGLALVSADGFDSKAVEYARKAMELDPKLVEAHELMANLLLEDSDEAKAFARGGRGAENFSRSARRHGHSRRHRTAGRPLARRVARENSRRSIPCTAKATR